MTRRASVVALVLAFVALAAPIAAAADSAIGIDKLVAILVRALAYDRSLDARAGDAVVVAVLSTNDRASRATSAAVLEAFKPLTSARLQGRPLSAVAVEWTDAAALGVVITQHGVDAVILCPGLEPALPAIIELARRTKVTTLTTVPAFVEQGAAVGVTMEDGKPRLLVNLTASRAEGSQLSSELVGLAKVIR